MVGGYAARVPTNATLVNGLRLLAELNDADEALGGAELARRLGLGPAQVRRLLATLVEQGFCQRDEDRARYRPAMRTIALAHTVLEHDPLRRRVLPVLQDLAQATGCDVCCSVPDGDAALVVAAAWPGGVQAMPDASLGRRLGAGSASLQLLGAYGRAAVADLVAGDRSLTDPATARREALACEREAGGRLRTAAAAVARGTEIEAALAVIVPPERAAQEPGILTRLQQAARIVPAS